MSEQCNEKSISVGGGRYFVPFQCSWSGPSRIVVQDFLIVSCLMKAKAVYDVPNTGVGEQGRNQG